MVATKPNSIPVCPNSPCRPPSLDENDEGKTTGREKNHCLVMEKFNRDMVGLFHGQWNLTCTCDKPGMVFDLGSYRCVDVDECQQDGLCTGGEFSPIAAICIMLIVIRLQ